MKVLITGGGGFIGSHLAEGHLDRGDTVWGVDTGMNLKVRHLLDNPKFHYVKASVLETFRARTRPEQLTDVVSAFESGLVVHTGEDIASSDEMISMIETALKGTKREVREAFILSGIEGFSLDEIAAITDRKPEQVRESIVAAREHLRKFPPIASQFRKKQLQNTGTTQ